jgi:hypothetical protein
MKKALLFCLLLGGYACSQPKNETGIMERTAEKPWPNPFEEGQIRWIDAPNFGVVVLDSCEYIASQMNDGYQLTHKGNCKYCALRKDTTSLKPMPVEEEEVTQPVQEGIAKHQ